MTLPSAPVQLAAVLRLRRRMARGRGTRVALVVAPLLLLALVALAAGSAAWVPEPALVTALELAPQAYLGFGLLALVAPLAAGGGDEVLPPEQLDVHPVRPAAQFLGGLLLAPVNLVWVAQLLFLVAETAYLSAGGDRWPGAVTTLAFVLAVTATGQALAWVVVGVRVTRRGRRAVLTAAALVALAVLVLVRSGGGAAVLERTPTRSVVDAVVAGAQGERLRWGLTTLVLLAVAGAALLVGARACTWALRRAPDAAGAARPVRRAALRPSALAQLVRTDRRSVWRAPALRRGGLVLALLPGLIAAGAQVSWSSLVVLAGLVAAGAGVLFGVNAFSLDGGGATWLASLPVEPGVLFLAKARVLLETLGATVAVALLAGAARAPALPSAAEASAVLSSAVACTAAVLAVCLASSVRRPHRADLSGPRGAVLPPGALAMASLRLAVPAALVSVLVGSAGRSGVVWLPPAVALPVLLVCLLSLVRSARRWADPRLRAGVVHAVSAG